MKRVVALGLVAGVLGLGAPATASAQGDEEFLAVGEMAPDFEVVGATRYGYLADPIGLSDFRGQTVVLAFFFRARTPG